MRRRDGTPIPRTGQSTPCRTKDGCPKGTPDAQRSLNPQNQQVWSHYCQCEAVGRFPDDSIVERHAGIIRQIKEAHGRAGQQQLTQLIVAAFSGG